ncbi:MAG TPA: glycosyltransferase, partial [Methanobacterium sp.]
MSISVIIPAFNEEKTVGNVVKTVKKVSYIDEVIVVDDGSYDNTSKVAEKAGATVIQHVKNRGK